MSTFGDLSSQSGKVVRKTGTYKSGVKYPQTQGKARAGETITRDDMVPASALVSIFLLRDVNFENPVATVKTDVNGIYSITTDDVRPYLLGRGLIDDTTSDADILVAFRALGKFTVRALVVRDDGAGGQTAQAIQSIADPNDLDEETGEPRPTTVDPIVHRVVKTIVNQISESLQQLDQLGFSAETINTLTESVIATVSSEIERVLEEADQSVIEIPEGQSAQSIIAAQEDELKLDIEAEDLTNLANVLAAEEVDEEQVAALESTVVNADEIVDDDDSTLGSSLDSDQQGLLAGLESALNDTVSDNVSTTMTAAEEAGELDALFELEEGQTAQEALAAAQAEANRVLREALRKFFLSMGLVVVVDANDAGDAGVIAINLFAPAHIPGDQLPGQRALGNRNIRLFKIGDGDLDAGSNFTNDPEAALGVPDSNGVPQAPLYYAPSFSDIVSDLLNGQTEEAFQLALDSAFNAINDPEGTPSSEDYLLVDRLRIYHELARRMEDTALVSQAVINKLVDNKNATIKISRLASVLADNFTWVNEDVNLTPDGFPIFTGRRTALSGGAHVINSSELVKALSLTLGDTAAATSSMLTQRKSFYAQFAPDAVHTAIEKAKFSQSTSFNLLDTLLDTYPSDEAGYATLILGSATIAPTPAYQAERDRLARGLSSAVPATLFGRTLTSESAINVRSALFFLDLLMRSSYITDTERGYFTEFTITDSEGVDNVRLVPNFDNYKFMVPGDSVTVATLVSSLLNVTQISNGEFFPLAQSIVFAGIDGLPSLPEYQEQNLDDFAGDLGSQTNSVNVSCTIERFDGIDPASGDAQDQLNVDVFVVNYNPATGEFQRGENVGATVSSALVAGEGPARRTYTIEGLSPVNGETTGRDYLIRFSIDSYQNPLPELFVWVDGWVPELNICGEDHPMFIGPDQEWVPVPGLGLMADQSRPLTDGTVGTEGIDLSNFSVPGAPVYLTTDEESAGMGSIDFNFVSSAEGYDIEGANGAVFAPLYGGYQGGVLMLSIDESAGFDPLFGIHSVIGANVRGLLEGLAADASGMTNTIALDPTNFDYDRLYIMRDAGGKFWILELRFMDIFTEPNGDEQAFIDFGFARVNSLGEVKIPDAGFDSAGPSNGEGAFHEHLLYGDWLVLDNPEGYTGPRLLEPQEVSFGGNDDFYTQLEGASTGIFIRYASNHFEDNITSADDVDTVFGNPPDYSSIPVRLNAGRAGITFVKLSFNKQNKTWVMEPSPENASSFVGNLKHNNIVAIFDNMSETPDTPAYLARVVRDKPADDPYANFELGLELVRFDEIAGSSEGGDLDPREVVCFTADSASCPSDHPSLSFASDPSTPVGTVFDSDRDGVPALFDPNDNDPNVTGGQPPAGGGTAGGGHGYGLSISAMVEATVEGDVDQGFLLKTEGLWPGDVQAVILESEVFGVDAGPQVVFTCSPPSMEDDVFTDYQCNALSLDGGASASLHARSGEGISFKLSTDATVMEGLGDRVDFNYTVTFRQPQDLDGTVLMCGTEECPAQPDIEGHASVLIPESTATFSNINVEIGSNEPTALSGLSSLDVTREIAFRGALIPGARDYRLNIHCPGSQPGEEYLPEESIDFWAPGSDHTGRDIQAEFFVNVPWIGNRSCNFNISAYLENDAGESVGLSTLSIDGVNTTGGDGGGYIDNELVLSLDGSVCLVESAAGLMVSSEACNAENTLFTVAELPLDESSTATLNFGSSVSSAWADGGRTFLTAGNLNADAIVSFNVDFSDPDNIVPPTCGVVSSDEFSDTCGSEAGVMTEFFVISSDGSTLMLDADIPFPMTFEGPVDESGNVPLNAPGFFVLVDDMGEQIMELGVDSFMDAVGEQQAWAEFTLTKGGNDYNGDSSPMSVTAPGFMQVMTASGQPVDIDLRFVRQTEMKIAWWLPPPRLPLVGDHDLNGDEVADLNVSYSAPNYVFTFSDAFSVVTVFGDMGAEDIEADIDGNYVHSVDESRGWVDFNTAMADGPEMGLYAELQGGGAGLIEWWEFHGGGGDGGCSDCPQMLINFGLDVSAPTSLYLEGDGYFNLEAAGSEFLIFTASETDITVELPEGISGIDLNSYDHLNDQPLSGSPLVFTREDNVSYFIDYFDPDSGASWQIDVYDSGFDVVVSVFGGPGGDSSGCTNPDGTPCDGGEPPRDIDGDGHSDDFDNCVLIPNEDQMDSDLNGLGDLCDVAVPDMSGYYLATLMHLMGSEEFDDETGSCVAGEDTAAFAEVEQIGNQVIFRFETGEENDEGPYAIMEASGDFTLISDESFGGSGSFDETGGAFTFSYDEVSGSDDGMVLCSGAATVDGELPTPVTEQSVADLGIYWFEADSWDSDGDGMDDEMEFEYGNLVTDTVESIFVWDFLSTAWMDISSEELGTTFHIGSGGVTAVDDLYIIDDFVSTGETMIVRPTDAGSPVMAADRHIDLEEFNIEGFPQFALMDKAFGIGLDESAVFSAGARAYMATMTYQADVYEFECDYDYDDWFDTAGLSCNNIVASSWTEVSPGNFDPTPATDLDQLINTFTEVETAPSGFIWIGEGWDDMGEYNIEAVLASETGDDTSAIAVIYFKRYFDGGNMMISESGTMPVNIGGIDLLVFDVPEDIIEMADLEEEDVSRFFFEESTMEGSPMVREGYLMKAGTVEQFKVFNATAGSDVISAFSPMMP